MKRIKALIALTLLPITFLLAQNTPKGGELEIVEATFEGSGKCPPDYVGQYGNIEKKYITSALFVKLNGADSSSSIPINDKVFDYQILEKNIYPNKIHQKVKISAKRFIKDGKEVWVAYAIE